MAHQDDLGVVVKQILNGRQSCTDTSIVGYNAILQRHVKINAHKNALTIDIGVTNGLLCESHVIPLSLHVSLNADFLLPGKKKCKPNTDVQAKYLS